MCGFNRRLLAALAADAGSNVAQVEAAASNDVLIIEEQNPLTPEMRCVDVAFTGIQEEDGALALLRHGKARGAHRESVECATLDIEPQRGTMATLERLVDREKDARHDDAVAMLVLSPGGCHRTRRRYHDVLGATHSLLEQSGGLAAGGGIGTGREAQTDDGCKCSEPEKLTRTCDSFHGRHMRGRAAGSKKRAVVAEAAKARSEPAGASLEGIELTHVRATGCWDPRRCGARRFAGSNDRSVIRIADVVAGQHFAIRVKRLRAVVSGLRAGISMDLGIRQD